MYYSVYPKLRAIYSILPTSEEIGVLIKSHGLSGFNSYIRSMNLLKRFPIEKYNMPRHLTHISFELSISVQKRLSGSSSAFFETYRRLYELKDIKSILRGGRGYYCFFLEKEDINIEDLNALLKDGFWKNAWKRGYSRFKDTERIVDIEIQLDQHYYYSLLEADCRLPRSDREETRELILFLINLTNRNWIYRLKKYYKMESYELKRFLIPEGEVCQRIEDEEGIKREEMIKEFYRLFYKDFKMRMFTMRSILAFFLLLDMKIDQLLSIYYAKLMHIEEERINKIAGMI